MSILRGGRLTVTDKLLEPRGRGNVPAGNLWPRAPVKINLRRMSLTAKLDQDIKEAMKAKEADKLGALRMLKSSLKYAVIEKGAGSEGELADADVISVVRKRIKQCLDAAEGFAKGGREEQAAKEKAEIALLEAYLPAALSADELATLVREAIAATGATGKAQMGAVMKAVMAKAAGRTDGKAVNAEVLKQLG
jgi:uncharacterized protein YqeY